MEDIWFRPLVWMDYRLGVLSAVIVPLVLLIWSLFARKEAITRLLIIYWRVASLLMITVYLLIPDWKIGFITSFAAKVAIAISLWFWVDLNEEIRDLPQSAFKLVFTSWRWAMTGYCVLGAIAQSIFLPCGLSTERANDAFCQVWLEAPQAYRNLLHTKPGNEGFWVFWAQ